MVFALADEVFVETQIAVCRERAADCVAHSVGDRGGAAETNFGLRGVYVHVNLFRRHFDEEERGGVDAVREDRAVAFCESARDESVADVATVDEEVLCVARRASLARGRDIAAYVCDRRVSALDFEQAVDVLRAYKLVV